MEAADYALLKSITDLWITSLQLNTEEDVKELDMLIRRFLILFQEFATMQKAIYRWPNLETLQFWPKAILYLGDPKFCIIISLNDLPL